MNYSRLLRCYSTVFVMNFEAVKSETSSYLTEPGVTADCEDGCVDSNGANLIDNIHGNYENREVKSNKVVVYGGSVYYVIDLVT